MTPRQVLLLFVAAFFWGTAYPFIGMALEGFSWTAVVFLRCAMAGIALLAVILLWGKRYRAALSDLYRRPGPALLLAVTSMTAPFLLISFAQQRVPGGLTGVIVAATPIFVGLYALRLDRTERFGRRRAVGLAVGLVGVALVVGLGAVSTMGQFLSALVILVAAALFALAGFVTKSYYEGVPPITRAFFALLITSGLTAIPAAATIPDGAPGTGALIGILLLGLGSTACGLYAYFTLIDEVGAGRAALVTYLGPGFSLLMGALLLGERIAPVSVVGLALILGGVVIASRADHPAEIQTATPRCEGLATGHPEPDRVPAKTAPGPGATGGEVRQ
ncbi:MAG: hypothetical protein AVDCRST_MAG01-01-2269 [uncultured Rubrobacteraceae bacterium]|uniref:EamA domain-containing protein n=1 Tax=uncultured Rubrobacteraceae bacterium TaxID=349277 RepID=A0A6J4PS53_9ACTN|nr:MAG: hypothetical protein AVDCRST_MAG01-01-2269 [uncultured Rubrobacteraceae bacterium]